MGGDVEHARSEDNYFKHLVSGENNCHRLNRFFAKTHDKDEQGKSGVQTGPEAGRGHERGG